MIQALVANVIARAQELLPQLIVEDFPGDPEAYRLTHPKGAVLVVYTGSDYGDPKPMAFTPQDRRMKVDLVLQICDLARGDGAYAALETLRKGFTGWEATGCLPAWISRDAFRGAQEGVFQYVITVLFPTRVALPAQPELESPDPLQLTLTSEF